MVLILNLREERDGGSRIKGVLAGASAAHELFFVLCKSCFWTASVFAIAATPSSFSFCPACRKRDVAFIPLKGAGTQNEA
jgi:hypothetical protein